MIIVADSGSTTIDWRIIPSDGVPFQKISPGVNPVFQSSDEILSLFKGAVGEYGHSVRKLFFYGAGLLSGPTVGVIRRVLALLFPHALIETASDLLGAARSLFGREAGVAAILGTGSNSGLYDGVSITGTIHSGGFILGDEGSGAYLGKRLLSDYIKGVLPDDISDEFDRRYGLDYPSIVEKVYREALPSRFLASFSPFIKEYEDHPFIHSMLKESFSLFLRRNVSPYMEGEFRQEPLPPLGIVGSIAVAYRKMIMECAEESGISIVNIVKSGGDGLVKFHGNYAVDGEKSGRGSGASQYSSRDRGA